jgi:hypothetical protein
MMNKKQPMKPGILLAAFIFLLQQGMIAQDLGRVNIRNASEGYPQFIVSMNGIRITNEYSHQVAFDYLDDYNYRVKVLQSGSAKPLSFMLNSSPKYISRYILNRDAAGNYFLVLESKSLIGSQPEPQAPPTSPSTVVITNPSSTVIINSGPQVIPDEDYQGMLSAIKKESFENGKLDLAETLFGAPRQQVSSVQVLGVLKLFAFENSRLTFAKFAYDRVIDPNSYYKVYDAFSFSSSKKELSDYMNKKNADKK